MTRGTRVPLRRWRVAHLPARWPHPCCWGLGRARAGTISLTRAPAELLRMVDEMRDRFCGRY